MPSLKKIVIIGPESTGKTTLCESLAHYYDCRWVPEFAREHLLANGMGYTYDDLLAIAHGQTAMEDRLSEETISMIPGLAQKRSIPVLMVDTDMYVMKVWCEFVFGKCHQWIIDQIVSRQYDLYLLCNIDLPWVKDELREYPDLENREKLFHIYKDILINQNTAWIQINGDHDQRLQTAIDAINKMIN